jgi:N-acyl-D-amino-acid deacylase
MTTLIRNVQIVVKGADDPKRADVLISGEKISAIGSFPKKQADVVIDGQGCYASSGFIDVHDSSDHYMKFFEREAWDGALKNGITTIIAGHEGVSLAPLNNNGFSLFKPWTETKGLTAGWSTMKEFLKYAGGLKLPVNIASFAGVDSLGFGFENNKSEVLAGALIYALKDGAAGLSLDMAGAGAHAFSTKEMQEFRNNISRNKKAFSIRLDAREDIEPQMKTIASFFARTDCRIIISCLIFSPEKYSEAYKLFETHFGKNKNAYFDGGALLGGLCEASRLLPGWVFTKEHDVLEQLESEWTRKRVASDITIPDAKLFVAYAHAHEKFVGHTLEELAGQFEVKDQKQALVELLRATRLRTSLYIIRDTPFEFIEGMTKQEIISDKKTLLGSYSAGVFHSLHAAVMGTHALGRPYAALVEDAHARGFGCVSSLVEALTQRPASLFALKERGELRAGYFADIVVFGNEIKYTIVNGTVAYDGTRAYPSAGRAIAL